MTRFCHPVDVGAGWHQDCSINRFREDGKLESISTGGIHKVFPRHFNKVLRLLLRGLNIDCIWAEDLANTLQKSLSKYNIDADPSFSLLFNFSWYLLLFSAESHEDIQNRQRKDRNAAIMLHCHPCEQLCSFKSAYPDTDLLSQIPGLISKLSHCDGHAWRSGFLDEPGCYHPALLTLFSYYRSTPVMPGLFWSSAAGSPSLAKQPAFAEEKSSQRRQKNYKDIRQKQELKKKFIYIIYI